MSDPLQFERYTFSPIDANMYAAVNGEAAVIIDPSENSLLLEKLHRLNVKKVLILLTHEHYDHITGVNYFCSRFDSSVVCTEYASQFISVPTHNRVEIFAALLRDTDRETLLNFSKNAPTAFSCSSDFTFEDSFCFTWHGFHIKMYAAPGHSKGSCIIFIGDSTVFTGDSWINGHSVITKMRGSSAEDYKRITFPLLLGIKPDSVIMPGHGEPFIKGNLEPA